MTCDVGDAGFSDLSDLRRQAGMWTRWSTGNPHCWREKTRNLHAVLITLVRSPLSGLGSRPLQHDLLAASDILESSCLFCMTYPTTGQHRDGNNKWCLNGIRHQQRAIACGRAGYTYS